ncbi:MAG: hypothetical protein RL160_32 [Bacteroidota bacterium]|jgi:hypothetical protein
MKRLFIMPLLLVSTAVVAQPGPIHIPDSLLQRGFQAQPWEPSSIYMPPPWSYSEPNFTLPTSYVLFTLDSTPHRRVDSLKRAVDSIVLSHQTKSTEITARHQKAIMQVQAQSQELASTLARFRKLFFTALALIMSLVWMLFRVRRAAMRGKPLVLRHESAHEPTAGIS